MLSYICKRLLLLRVALVGFKMWQRLILRGLQRLSHFSQSLPAPIFLNASLALPLFSTLSSSHFFQRLPAPTFFNASLALPLFAKLPLFCNLNFPQLFSSVELAAFHCSSDLEKGGRAQFVQLMLIFWLLPFLYGLILGKL